MLSVGEIITFVFITALCVFIACVQIYGIYRFRSLRHLVVIQKRYPAMVQLEAIALILLLLVGIPALSYGQHVDIGNVTFYLVTSIPTFQLIQFITDIEAC